MMRDPDHRPPILHAHKRARLEHGVLAERAEARHKPARADDLAGGPEHGGAVAVGRLVEPGQRLVVQRRPAQPLLALVERLPLRGEILVEDAVSVMRNSGRTYAELF